MRVADDIANWLSEEGIVTAYGIIGGGNHIIFDAISKNGATEIVCCHHEQAAAMASTYHNRIARKIESVVLCTTGAGSTNTLTGVMAAWMDSIPLLVLSGNEGSKYMGAPTRVWGVQGYNSSGAVAGYTKWSSRAHIRTPIRSQLMISKAVAMSPRQGPCWLDIPKDVQGAMV